MEISENASSKESNHRLRSQETPNKPLDDASNICESSNTCTLSEFLKSILRDFCDGTTFYHLWDHKILFKRDDRILHVSEVRFGNRSRIENKLYIYTQTAHVPFCEYWISTAQVEAMLLEKREVPGFRNYEYLAYTLNVRSDSFWKLTQLSKRICNHCVKIHVVPVMSLSLFPHTAVWFEHQTILCEGHRSTH